MYGWETGKILFLVVLSVGRSIGWAGVYILYSFVQNNINGLQLANIEREKERKNRHATRYFHMFWCMKYGIGFARQPHSLFTCNFGRNPLAVWILVSIFIVACDFKALCIVQHEKLLSHK